MPPPSLPIESPLKMKEHCSDCKQLEEKIYWNHFQSMQFCQILTGDFHSQLMIPEKFTQKLREKLKQKLGLTGPSGANWEVQLANSDNMLYFGNGWGNFVEAHCLVEKDVLIFKYRGDSQFDVLMFEGSSLCEKESSYFVRKCGHIQKNEDGRTRLKETSVEIIQEHCNTDSAEKEKYVLGGNDEARFDGEKGEFSPNKALKLTGSKKKAMGEGIISTPYHLRPITEAIKLKQISVGEDKSTTYKNSQLNDMKNASDDEPVSAGAEDEFGQNLSHVWEPVKLPGSNQMTEFASGRNEFSSNQAQVWEPVKLPGVPSSKQIKIKGKCTAYQKTRLSDAKHASHDEPKFAGAEDEPSKTPSQVWEQVKLCGLKVKQTPTGEVISTPYHLSNASNRRPVTEAAKLPELAGAEHEFRCRPSQTWEPVKLPGSNQTNASNRRTVPRAQKFAAMRLATEEVSKSEGSFLIVMRPTHVSKRFYMAVPAEWATENGVEGRQDAILRTKGRSWKARLIINADGRGGISRGWKDFALDNRLEEFDVCVFKLATPDEKPVVLDVSIFRVMPEPEVPPADNKRKFSQIEDDVSCDVL